MPLIREGTIVTVRDGKAHPLCPFKPGDVLRVVSRVGIRGLRDRCDCEHTKTGAAFSLWVGQLRTLDYLEVDGELKSLEQWAAPLGIGVAAMKGRLKYGWSDRDAVTLKKGTRPKETTP